MKYSFMTFSTPDLTFQEIAEVARKYGYNGVELRTECNHRHDVELTTPFEKMNVIKQQVKSYGVEISCLALGSYLANPKEFNLEKNIAYLKLASFIGAPCVRVFGGRISEGVTRDQAKRHLIQSFRELAPIAKEEGVYVCLESHDDWCNPDDIAEVMKEVDHPNVAVNWDISHTLRLGGKTPEYTFQLLQPWIRHVHFHDTLLTTSKYHQRPMGQGEIDHVVPLKLLKNSGYDGYLSGEWFYEIDNWEPYDIHLPREIAMMRSYEAIGV
jgi:sugar phosphate isomerase/epimerase